MNLTLPSIRDLIAAFRTPDRSRYPELADYSRDELTAEFTEAQLQNPPYVYAFKLPPPNETVDVFEGDFKKQHTPGWWRKLFEQSGLLHVEYCQELDDAEVLYEELVRYQHEHGLDPFDVEICLEQMAWGRTHQPRKSLFVLTASKLSE